MQTEQTQPTQNLINTILTALALAMGVAIIVLSQLGSLTTETGIQLLGLGLAALAIVNLRKQ